MAPLLAHKPGVDRAFERLYRRHALDVYRYAYGVLRNQADAEDVTQTTFMNAYRALERGETPESPQNWLIAIAHNVCRQRFRQASRRVQEVGLEVDVADTLVGVEDDSAPSPEDIKRALGHLAFNQRSALVMRELEGRSYAEIADLLGVSVSAVETLIFRARRALREQLEEAITCGQAEQLLSLQLDKQIDRSRRSQLRAHIRECADCRKLARSQRAQRSALKSLGAVSLPSSLSSLFGGGSAAVAAKVAGVVVATSIAGGIGYSTDQLLQPAKPKHVVHHTAPKRTRTHHLVPIAAVEVPAHARPHAAPVRVAPPRRTIVRRTPVVAPQPAREPAAPVLTTTTTTEHPAPPGHEKAPAPQGGNGEANGHDTSGGNGKANGHSDGGAAPGNGNGNESGKGKGHVDVPTPPVEAPPVSVPPVTVPAATTPAATTPAVTTPDVTTPQLPPVTTPALPGH